MELSGERLVVMDDDINKVHVLWAKLTLFLCGVCLVVGGLVGSAVTIILLHKQL